jgi:eukaryotic-like serine/threonine-protein kinase
LCVKDDEEVAFSQPIDVYAFGATALQMLRGTLPSDLRKIPPKLPCPIADFTKQTISLPKPIAEALNACLNPDPKERPKMRDVRDLLAAQLLRDRHKATLVIGSEIHTLGAKNRTVNINIGSVGSIQIKYDGLQFVITAVSGSVTINNLPVTKDQALPGSCVVILGAASLGANRRYITVDVSHPEVVL